MTEFLDAFQHLLTFTHLAYLSLGVVVGLVIGIIPGLGGIAGMSLLLPFLYGMEPSVGLGMLMGLVAVVPTGDTFTSVLMGIPGSSASQATVMDGFPLAKQGMAARALSAAFASSMLGGVAGAMILSVFIVVARPLVLSFSSAELFMLTLLGLSVVASLAGGNVFKGFAACGAGLLLGTIGSAPATGEYRLNLGIDYLFDGIPLVVVGLGIFALPEIIDLLIKDRAIANKPNSLGQGWSQGIKDVFNNLPLVGKCSVFGSLIGAIPGLGGSVVDWMTYSYAMQSSKDKSRFGKGEIKGVIAPESANNACSCGSMIPTLLFGVPGSGTAAVFLGGMLLLGLQPGISMVGAHLDLTYTIIWSLALANILGALLCLGLTSPVAMLTRIPFSRMAPVLLTLILFAAYQATRSLGDFIALGAIACIGVLLKGANWPRPAFLIGFVLAPGAENYFFQSIQFYGYGWMQRPGVIAIASLILLSFVAPMVRSWLQRRRDARQAGQSAETEVKQPAEREAVTLLDWVIIGLMLLASVLAVGDIWSASELTKAFPLMAISIMGFSVAMVVVRYWMRSTTRMAASISRELVYILAFFALAVLYFTVGFISTTAVFTLFFLRFATLARWRLSGTVALGLTLFLIGMGKLMSIDYPAGFVDPYLLGMLGN
ncbi:tricarboxylate transporter [Pokkaliibacter plantistimulans]|uniref:Tricarboxylate transporter n=1 Tax=Proteobacteria bacterium 228 TaxID=2083153 RepID=A0A2S5KP29_9PROT|nr:tripartite tricarboxylate transporter permease [Pokkaliibacter plantistimulans]PPC76046.1 tricarboxylate transporter [Pokkaliibacter plantistimulans]